jgi:hypothetical protein
LISGADFALSNWVYSCAFWLGLGCEVWYRGLSTCYLAGHAKLLTRRRLPSEQCPPIFWRADSDGLKKFLPYMFWDKIDSSMDGAELFAIDCKDYKTFIKGCQGFWIKN